MPPRKRNRLAPGVYLRNGNYSLAFRDERLPGGRIDRSLRTDDAETANRRAAAVRFLLERAEYDVIANWGRGEIHIADIEAAVREMDTERLKRLNAGTLTLREECDKLLRTVGATREQSTLEAYEHTTRALIEHFGADRPMYQVTSEECAAFLHSIKPKHGRPWSPHSQRGHLARASRLWKDAIAREVEAAEQGRTRPRLTRNPWTAVELPRAREKREEFLRPEEIVQLLDANRGFPECGFVALGVLAGLRMQEAANLRTRIDVLLARRRVEITPRTGLHPWKPKTDNGVRYVPIVEALHPILAEHERLFARDRYFLAGARADRPFTNTALQEWCRRAFERAGIQYGAEGDGITYHNLRHTFATHLLLGGVPVHVVARLMGDTTETVLSTYAHLLHENLEEGVAVMDRVVTEGAAK